MDEISLFITACIIVVIVVLVVQISYKPKYRRYKKHVIINNRILKKYSDNQNGYNSTSNSVLSDDLAYNSDYNSKDSSIFITDEAFGVKTTYKDGTTSYVDYINSSSQYISKNLSTDTSETTDLYNFDFDTVKEAFSYINTQLGAYAFLQKMLKSFAMGNSSSTSNYDGVWAVSDENCFGIETDKMYAKIYPTYWVQGTSSDDEEKIALDSSYRYSEWRAAFDALNTVQEKYALCECVEYFS